MKIRTFKNILEFLFILFLFYGSNHFTVDCYVVAPIVSPLKYITIPVIGEYLKDYVENFFVTAIVPFDTQDAVAIFISEGVSGALGGLASKAVSLIDGNKNNRESGITNAGE